MINLKDISKVYKSKKGKDTQALAGINLKLGDFGLTFILGKSGSGKSTLLNILGGIDSPTSGELFINEKKTKDFSSKDWNNYRNTYVGFIFQEYNLLDSCNVYENIKLSLELQGKACSETLVLDVLKKVGLNDVLKRKVNELSGGEKQRVAIARALIKNPKIILADEPTGNLDSETSTEIFKILKDLSKERLVIVVTHDEESAIKYNDRIIKIADGKVISDSVKEIKSSKEDFSLHSAHLPFLYSFKMGIRNLFKKKLKLVFNLVALTICFLCLGVTVSVKNSNLTNDLIKKFSKNGGTEAQIYQFDRKIVWVDVVSNLLKGNVNDVTLNDYVPIPISMSNATLEEIKKNTNKEWNAAYYIYNGGYVTYGNENLDNPVYYSGNKYIHFSTFEAIDKTKLLGSTSSDGIVITSFLADYIMYNGIKAKNIIDEYSEEYLYKPSSYEELINKTVYIKLNNFEYQNVVGILKVDTTKYEELKKYSSNEIIDSADKNVTKLNILEDELHNDLALYRVYISEDKLNAYKSIVNNITSGVNAERIKYNGAEYFSDAFSYGYLNSTNTIYNGVGIEDKSDVDKSCVVINTKLLDLITNSDYSDKLRNYLSLNPFNSEIDYLNIYLNNNDIIGKNITSNIDNNKVYLSATNFINYKISGVIIDDSKENIIYFNRNNVSNLMVESVSLRYAYHDILDVKELKEILKFYPVDNSDKLLSTIYNTNMEDSALSSYVLTMAGLVGSIAFSIIGVLFLINIIFTSIKLSKKELGILKALGCNNFDLLLLFTAP